jgi:hypothetical protein
MYFVDLIVKGVVLEVREPFNRRFGKATPSLIEVDEVIHGELEEDAITLLHRGTPDTDVDNLLLSPGEEVILLLTNRTTDGFHWPYSSGVGVWRVTDGRVQSGPCRMYGTVEPHPLDSLQNMRVDKFIQKIRKAADNNRRPIDLMDRKDG